MLSIITISAAILMAKKPSSKLVVKARKSKQAIKKSDSTSKNLHKHMIHRSRFSRFLRVLGPGIVTGAADDDPSGIITYSQAGAGFGLGFLWAFPIMYPLLIAVQESCSRIGAVTGKGLSTVIKDNYSRKVLYICVLLVVVANTINIGSDLGAMAATTQLFIDIPNVNSDLIFTVLAVFYALVIILLVIFVSYKRYAKILKWLAISLFAYPITALLVGQDWPQLIQHTFFVIPTINATTIYILVGILGTTISPYCFFWDTSEVVEEEIAHHRLSATKSDDTPKLSKRFLKNIRLDNLMGMTLTVVSAWFIVVACASVLYNNGVHNITNAADAAKALEPLVKSFPYAGLVAKVIFSIGIIGIGLLAVPVLAGSSSYAICEMFGWKEGLYRKFSKAYGFYIVIILATFVGMLINFIGIDPIQALIFTAVFNGVASVPLIWMIVRIGNNEMIMGQYKNGLLSNIFVRITLLVMTLTVLALFFFAATGQLR